MERDRKGLFARGNQAAKGRGKKQQTNQQLRAAFEELVLANVDKLQQDFIQVSPKDRLDIIAKLAPYFLPKLQSVEMTTPPTDLAELMQLTPEQRTARIIELKRKMESDELSKRA